MTHVCHACYPCSLQLNCCWCSCLCQAPCCWYVYAMHVLPAHCSLTAVGVHASAKAPCSSYMFACSLQLHCCWCSCLCQGKPVFHDVLHVQRTRCTGNTAYVTKSGVLGLSPYQVRHRVLVTRVLLIEPGVLDHVTLSSDMPCTGNTCMSSQVRST
jgi:hypothetical protein